MTKDEAVRKAREYYDPLIQSGVRQCRCGEWFFAENLKYVHCSPKCSEDSQRTQKRMWWRRNRAINRGSE